MPRIQLPDSLAGVFFEHVWETSRIWELPTAEGELPIGELWWHVDLPIWSTVPGEPRFDRKPSTVMSEPLAHTRH
jgi:hypothetical protein